MTRREMLDELIERLETELDELSNAQIKGLIEEYEHSSILSSVVENLGDPEELEENPDDDKDDADEELPLIDDDWDENALDDEE